MKTIDFQKGVLRTCSGDFEKIGGRLNEEWAINYMHAMVGMSDEISELLLAEDKPNAVEEIGDFLWYIGLAYHAIGIEFDAEPEKYVDGRHPDLCLVIKSDCLEMTQLVGKLSSMFKAHIFYGREVDFEAVEKTLNLLASTVFGACYRVGASPEYVMKKNQEKLRARYPEKFTEENANVRDLEKEQAVLRMKSTAEAKKVLAAIEVAVEENEKETWFDPQY